MAVSQEVLTMMKKNEPLQFAIARAMNKKFRTVERWVRDNDDMLSSKAVLLVIKEETGLGESEILERETATA